MWIVCLTTRVSDRHLTENVEMQRSHQITWTAWQTRWLVAVHLDPMVRHSCHPRFCSASNRSTLSKNLTRICVRSEAAATVRVVITKTRIRRLVLSGDANWEIFQQRPVATPISMAYIVENQTRPYNRAPRTPHFRIADGIGSSSVFILDALLCWPNMKWTTCRN